MLDDRGVPAVEPPVDHRLEAAINAVRATIQDVVIQHGVLHHG
ncbi:Unknown protein sequence [Pseudomonas savastanoi pv. glycinea]|uniref:Uncharacterized protein n=1 Tax=Pseudomonas savastanoi pv. glycinea TaxID=318 RepID=A0AB74AXV2_PSESG|nr:Unknown protein sequence [Pseudomonas savastanoi pv. glycinea]KPC42825.1 Unknown protein sequence [Pseudomonas savastanoi pv. glycinea]KPC45381.1 Unknown protein sequence [Pseudomonas savastanoi pv. glycinea]RMM99154.1 hypothetical protein ALQ68_103501 [Pseudomonas savastanoi pv. glycinea]RMP86799.1 hypothetical protein ALQ14_103032 [Pseudomonas savastanoi pv. glycinea]